MYTIIKGDIYLIKDNKLVKQTIKKGVLKPTKEVIEMPKDLKSVLTYTEIRIKFINKFNEIEEIEEVEKPSSKVLDKDKEEDKENNEN